MDELSFDSSFLSMLPWPRYPDVRLLRVRVAGDLIGSSLGRPPHIYPHQLDIATGTLYFHLGKAVWSYHDVRSIKTVGRMVLITVMSSLVF